MTRRVLNVGQCGPDHAAISGMLRRQFGAVVSQTDHVDDTLAALRAQPFDLVLINRKLDIDYSDGLAVLRALKSDPGLAHVPVMLVSNYADAQAEAVAAGALPGFGKAELGLEVTTAKLEKLLGGSAAP